VLRNGAASLYHLEYNFVTLIPRTLIITFNAPTILSSTSPETKLNFHCRLVKQGDSRRLFLTHSVSLNSHEIRFVSRLRVDTRDPEASPDRLRINPRVESAKICEYDLFIGIFCSFSSCGEHCRWLRTALSSTEIKLFGSSSAVRKSGPVYSGTDYSRNNNFVLLRGSGMDRKKRILPI